MKSLSPYLLTTLLFASSLMADDSFTAQADIIFKKTYKADQPGAVTLVIKNGKTLYSQAQGMANMELGVPLKTDMVFRLGSITKQFTAASIMILAQQGKLEVADPLEKYLPDFPLKGITLEQLLNHTAGVTNYTDIPGLMESDKIRADYTTNQLIDLFRDLPADFAPGERFSYSNSGYVLLGAVIEKVSGMTYAEFVQKNIFDKLGMKNSYYGSNTRIIPKRVSGYEGVGEALQNASFLSMTLPQAAGSLLATVEDLALWADSLFSGKVISPQALEKMTTSGKLKDGSETGYGFGLVCEDYRGHRTIWHNGGINGFLTTMYAVPDQALLVIVLSNNGSASPDFLARKLLALALGDPVKEFEAISLSPEELQKYVGVYRINEKETRTVTFENGQLYTQRTGNQKLPILPSSKTEFFYENAFTFLAFVHDDSGKLTGMNLFTDDKSEASFAALSDEKPVERTEITLDPAILNAYVGTYELSPGFKITITTDGSQIFAQATGQSQFQIFADSPTTFFLKVVDAQISFVKEGESYSLILHQGGRDMPGKRLD